MEQIGVHQTSAILMVYSSVTRIWTDQSVWKCHYTDKCLGIKQSRHERVVQSCVSVGVGVKSKDPWHWVIPKTSSCMVTFGWGGGGDVCDVAYVVWGTSAMDSRWWDIMWWWVWVWTRPKTDKLRILTCAEMLRWTECLTRIWRLQLHREELYRLTEGHCDEELQSENTTGIIIIITITINPSFSCGVTFHNFLWTTKIRDTQTPPLNAFSKIV